MCPVIRAPSCFRSKYVRRTVPSGKGSRATQLPLRSAARQHTWAAARNRIGLIMCESVQSFHLCSKETSGLRLQEFPPAIAIRGRLRLSLAEQYDERMHISAVLKYAG